MFWLMTTVMATSGLLGKPWEQLAVPVKGELKVAAWLESLTRMRFYENSWSRFYFCLL